MSLYTQPVDHYIKTKRFLDFEFRLAEGSTATDAVHYFCEKKKSWV